MGNPYHYDEYLYFVSKISEVNRILLRQQEAIKKQRLHTYIKIWYPYEKWMTVYQAKINFLHSVNEIHISEEKGYDLWNDCSKIIFVDNGKSEQKMIDIMDMVYQKKVFYEKVELLCFEGVRQMIDEMDFGKDKNMTSFSDWCK